MLVLLVHCVCVVVESTQVIGMSATLTNMHEVAQFLQAEVYSDDFRPVSHNTTIYVHTVTILSVL